MTGDTPRFDADTDALRMRAAANAQRSRSDLEEWITAQISLRQGMAVLDLGCGLGKQLFYMANRLGADSQLLGLDISAAAVDGVNKRARDERRSNVTAEQTTLDGCLEHVGARRFDLVLSTYAIYYSKQMAELLRALSGVLNAGGTLFVSGPGAGTNREIVEIINGCAARSEPVAIPGDFISSDEIERVRLAYGAHRVARLDNAVDFASTEQALAWWRNHNLFQPAVEACVATAVGREFERKGRFILTKNVLGVRFDAKP